MLGAGLLALIAAMTLLTPAFTDYEAEIEPTLTALMRGDWATVGQLIPIYGGSLAVQAPFSAAGWVLGGDLGMYRATALPGAIGIVSLGVLAAGWVRAAGRPRLEQLAALLVVVASPALAQAWATGHHEEVLVASCALAGILLIDGAQERRGRLLLGALLLGVACGGKLWPVILVPPALAACRSLGDAIRVAVTAGTTALAMVVPNVLAHLEFFKLNVQAIGSAGIFSPGNLWWFLGARNPDWIDPRDGTRLIHAAGTSFRNPPGWVTALDHPLVVALALGLSAAWWLRMRGAERRGLGGGPIERVAADRTASLLLLVASIAWWRAVMDGWFQPYYLTTALAAVALADARRGRLPVTAGVAWAAMWLFAGQNNVTTNWSPDLVSAVTLAWAVPVGVWTTARALRSAG